jgi:hypothetical protein
VTATQTSKQRCYTPQSKLALRRSPIEATADRQLFIVKSRLLKDASNLVVNLKIVRDLLFQHFEISIL